MSTKDPLYVTKSKIKDQGVFASRNIKKGEKICVMKGEEIKPNQIDAVVKQGRNPIIDPLQIGINSYINMIKPYVLINHSCQPNAGLKDNVLFAIKSIKKNEEIIYDYSTTWFEGFECKCGSKNCRGYIGDFTSIPKRVRRRYLKLGVVPKFIREAFEL